jgi:transcriptional regulator with XRE-family HTH domain
MNKIDRATSYSVLNQRLCELMEEKSINMLTLAKQADVAVGTIQKLMTDPHCNPTIASLDAISKALNVTISHLLGQDEKSITLLGTNVVLLEWETLENKLPTHQSLTSQPTATTPFIRTSCHVSKQAFAVTMAGNSMLPLFPEGSLLIFDPEKSPYDNSYVLVKLAEFDTFVFKQLLIDEPDRYIKSLNPVFKDNIMKLSNQDKIIATLVQSQLRF